MRIAIIQFPGSNCERETTLAVHRAGMTAVDYLWNESPEKLASYDGYILVGGFSYEDRGRAGVIAALCPVMQHIKAQSELGKPVLGICNGAQILVETGLVPGLANDGINMALADNKRMQNGALIGTGYYNAWVHVKSSEKARSNAFTRHLAPDAPIKIPVAHAQGRFIIPEPLLQEIETQGLDVFHYCDARGEIQNTFPINPNGSVHNIAAITNKAGNVLAMMPHPERSTAGDALFRSMRDYIALNLNQRPHISTLDYQPTQEPIRPFLKKQGSQELVIELIITDNHAFSVESSLRQQGIPVAIKRQIHWEILCETPGVLHQIQASGLLYNEQKEFTTTPYTEPSKQSFLVRAKEDLHADHLLQQLQNHFAIRGIHAIQHGILWHVHAPQESLEVLTQAVLKSGILYNPASHECTQYG